MSRIEKDSLGDVKVPADAYWGAQTQRAIDNYPVSGLRFPLHFIWAYAMIKRSAAAANLSTGRLNSKKGQAIISACQEILKGKLTDQFVVDVYQAGAGTSTNMNLNEVIANRATELMGGKKGDYLVHPNDDVNMAQSTNDTFHSAMNVSAHLYTEGHLLVSLDMLEDAFSKKTKEFKSIVKTGRTHLMDAVPITLGQEFSGYASFITKNISDIRNTSQQLLELNLGGTAVGTGLNAEPHYIKQIYVHLNRITKKKFHPSRNMFESTQNFHSIMKLSGAMRGLASDLQKITSDLRMMSMLEELHLPAVQPGSSIMPGKVNPSILEMASMASAQVIGNDVTISNAYRSGQLELNVFMPVACYNILNSLEIMTNACSILAERCISGIKADRSRMMEHLEKDVIVVTALTPHIGYAKAAEIAKAARYSGRSVKDICLEMNVLPEKELDKILDYISMTKPGVMKKGK